MDGERCNVDFCTGDCLGCPRGQQYKAASPEQVAEETAKALERLALRTFETGATRDTDEGKYDYEGFLSPLVIRRFGEYMHKHRVQSDGTLRDSDNWQKGIPYDAYMKSGWRHFMDWWSRHRCDDVPQAELEEALCALMFNVQGYLHELLSGSEGVPLTEDGYPDTFA